MEGGGGKRKETEKVGRKERKGRRKEVKESKGRE